MPYVYIKRMRVRQHTLDVHNIKSPEVKGFGAHYLIAYKTDIPVQNVDKQDCYYYRHQSNTDNSK